MNNTDPLLKSILDKTFIKLSGKGLLSSSSLDSLKTALETQSFEDINEIIKDEDKNTDD